MTDSQSTTGALPRLSVRTVCVASGRTTMRLEPELWDALDEICRRERLTMSELVRGVKVRGNRTSSVRTYALTYFRAAATDAGHLAAGHGLVRAS